MAERDSGHCDVCGFPSGAGPRCGACGQPVSSGFSSSPEVPESILDPEEQEDTPPELIDAMNSFRIRNYAYYIPNCLNKIAIISMPLDQPDGKYWPIVLDRPSYRNVSLMVGLDSSRQTLCVEAPLVTLPAESPAPILRSALEINGQIAQGFRVALRRQVLMLRSLNPIASMRPLRLVRLVGAFADVAKDLELYFATRFSCPAASLVVSNQRGSTSGYLPPPRVPPFRLSVDGGERKG